MSQALRVGPPEVPAVYESALKAIAMLVWLALASLLCMVAIIGGIAAGLAFCAWHIWNEYMVPYYGLNVVEYLPVWYASIVLCFPYVRVYRRKKVRE